MAYQPIDPGFVGPSYEAPVQLQDFQRCINWFVERDPNEDAKEAKALLGCPGLNPLIQLSANLPVRGAWVLPGDQQALVVVGNFLWLVIISAQATQTSQAQFSATQVGTLLTNTGPVVMRDNGVYQNPPGLGGFCFIVDGSFGYYYLLSGAAQTVTFGAALTGGNATMSFSGTLPNGLIVSSGGILTDTNGSIQAGTLISSINTVALTLTMNQPALSNQPTDTVTVTLPVFGQITDPGFPAGCSRLAFIEGWVIGNVFGTRTFQTTGPTPYQALWPGSFDALKDSSTDNLVTLYENERELRLIGKRTSEVWYNSGISSNFAFSRIPGVGPQIGCSAQHSIARVGEQIIWLGGNEQGENMVVMNDQYSWKRISTHAIEHALASYPLVSDAIGYGYEEEGHLFYTLLLPTADVTWCYDMTSQLWHQRASFNATTGVFHRHRSNCFMNFANIRVVGDYQTGQLHQMSRSFYTDAGNPLVGVRRSPHIWDKPGRERVFFNQLQIEFTPGVGLQSGQGSQPTVMLRFSDDGGFTWSNQITASIGVAGATKNRCMFYLLGYADRDRVWEIQFSDPVPRDIIGATLYAEKSRVAA
jgi:hypothetical protein